MSKLLGYKTFDKTIHYLIEDNVSRKVGELLRNPICFHQPDETTRAFPIEKVQDLSRNCDLFMSKIAL